MKSACRWALAAAFLSTAACNEQVEAGTDSSEASVAAVSALRGTEMLVGWQSRAELATALGQTPDQFDFRDVTVPGVLLVQHQYSIAALRLNVASWAMVTGAPTDNPGPGSWGVDPSHVVVFPRRSGLPTDASFVASEHAAKKLFDAMTAATVTTEQVAPNVVVTTRSSAGKTFRCSKTVSTGVDAHTDYGCVIAGVSEVGGTGLVWRR